MAARGQDLSSTIIGCAALPCPNDPAYAVTAQCTVVDKTFPSIGIARIPVTSDALKGLSWTEGVLFSDSNAQRTFDKSFYLGTPPNMNLTGTGACAVFFNKVSGGVMFDGAFAMEAEGDCQEALSGDCVSALVKRATDLDVSGLGSVDACSKLEDAFKNNLDSACRSFALGNSWGDISVKPLTGSKAASPITAAENSTSNCWPILPKEDNLALVSSVKTIAPDGLSSTIESALYDITPILTLFYPGTGKLIAQAEAQMTCMKTVGPNAGANATSKPNSSASFHAGPVAGAALALTSLTFALF